MQRFPSTYSAPCQPRDLAGLIELYEGNYFRLRRLAPELESMSGTAVSRVHGALNLYLTVLERVRYTTTLSLTYRFPDDSAFIAEPDMRIRVYEDVRAVEVLGHCRRRRHQPNSLLWRRMPELNRRWELNRFLHKWLGFCQRQGHIFLRCTMVTLDSSSVVRVNDREI